MLQRLPSKRLVEKIKLLVFPKRLLGLPAKHKFTQLRQALAVRLGCGPAR
jgi:hypothetical protein